MSNPTEPKTETVSLRMARASEEDIETAFFIAGLLQDLDEVNRPTRFRTDFPRDLKDLTGETGPYDPDHFDPDDGEHCKIIVNRLIKALNHSPGCMNRVVWGYETLTSDANQLIDPDADHLAFHPRLQSTEDRISQLKNIVEQLIHSIEHETTPHGRMIEAINHARSTLG